MVCVLHHHPWTPTINYRAKITNLTNFWAQDGSWDYQTPIYVLSCNIRLQTVVDIITNQPDCFCLRITGQTRPKCVPQYIKITWA
jgi:hypothetical protein